MKLSQKKNQVNMECLYNLQNRQKVAQYFRNEIQLMEYIYVIQLL